MSMFPIGAVSKRTGISLDTLRAWERRYAAVVPERGARGRLYSEAQVQRLLLLQQAVEGGHAIGQVANCQELQLRQLVNHPVFSQSRGATTGARNELAERDILAPVFRALDRYDYAHTDREISLLAAAMAKPREFVHAVALPLMRAVGDRWHQGRCSIAQEHMVTNLLSTVLGSMVRTCTPSNPPARVLLATPRNDRHSFPTLAAAMLTAAAGLGVVYLGADLPAADIILAARRSEANAVLLSLSTIPGPEALEDLSYIARKLHRTKALWLGAAPQVAIQASKVGPQWLLINDFKVLEHNLEILGKSALPAWK